MRIIEFNNLFYLKNNPYEFAWAPDDWFPLNETTREHFKKDILPLIKAGECSITKDIYEKIKNFKQNIPNSSSPKTIVEPDGIILKPHQITAVNYMMRYNKFGFFLGTGTGKTLIAITWLLNVKPESCLIVTPQKVVGQYKEELDKYIVGNNYQVTNFEQLPHYLDKRYEALIVDESHKAKSLSTNINANLTTIASTTKYTYLFTGTPQDKKRFEILAQINILDQRVIPDKTKTKMINRYFFLDDYFNPQKENPAFSNELTTLIKAYTWGKPTEETIELTQEHNYLIKCKHPEDYYDTLMKNRVVIKRDNNERYACVADTPTKLRIYLREICSGYINFTNEYYANKIEHINTDKGLKLSQLITPLKNGIIYYEFTESLPVIEATLKTLRRSYVIVNGSVSSNQSAQLINQFKNNQVAFLVIQSKSGNAGLDLTNTNNIIFYSLPESYIVFHQCKSRIRRIGQEKECNYFYLICEDSIEEYILKSLRKKKSFTDKIFKQYL